MDKVEKMLEEMKKVWDTEFDCVCCRKTFRLGDMFPICGDCYTLFPKNKKVNAKIRTDARTHQTEQKEGLKHDYITSGDARTCIHTQLFPIHHARVSLHACNQIANRICTGIFQFDL